MNTPQDQSGSPDPADEPLVRVLLVVGPHGGAAELGGLAPGDHDLGSLGARVRRIDAGDEDGVVSALDSDAEAIVLDAGSLEHYSHRTAEAVARATVPVIGVRAIQESALGRAGGQQVVLREVSASVTGGGVIAYQNAIEAAAHFARQARADGPIRPDVPTVPATDETGPSTSA